MLIWIAAGALGIVALLGVAVLSQRLEEPAYRLVERDATTGIELRDYAAITVAETRAPGARREAVRRGFRPLAAYVFGVGRGGERIAMTAPVTQTPLEGGAWAVRFVMPAALPLARLPAPGDARVRLRRLPARRCAVLRFSLVASTYRLAVAETRLRRWLAARGLPADGAADYAYYDDPITPPCWRRNEVLIEVAPGADPGAGGARDGERPAD
ncbi:MAG: heme-binding protein [Paracoccaceae bacterium]